MKVDLKKMQNKVDKCIAVFTSIVDELNTRIGELGNAIDSNNHKIKVAKSENEQYAEKIVEYETLKNKVESIIK